MKIKANGKGGWKLLGAKPRTLLRRVTILFPSVQRHIGGKTTYHISGPAKVNIRVEYPNGTAENISGVSIEW